MDAFDDLNNFESEDSRFKLRQERIAARNERRRIRMERKARRIVNRRMNPYMIVIENTTDERKTCYALGFNKFWRHENFGNEEGIIITNPLSSYEELFAQSNTKAFSLSRIRINFNDKPATRFLKVQKDANGQTYQAPIMLTLNATQFQANLIDIEDNSIVDGNFHFEIDVEPKSTVEIMLYPERVISQSDILDQQEQTEFEKIDLISTNAARLSQPTHEIIKNKPKEKTWNIKSFFVKLRDRLNPKPKKSNLNKLSDAQQDFIDDRLPR